MTISAPSFSPFGNTTAVGGSSASTGAGPAGTVTAAQAASEYRDLAAFRLGVIELRDALDSLGTTISSVRVRSRGTDGAVSSADIGVNDSPATAARLVPAQQVNATPTSYTPLDPDFERGSTVVPTIDGAYNGEDGDARYRIRARDAGTLGEDDIRIRINIPGQGFVEQFTIAAGDAAGQVYELSNGLRLSFSDGDFRRNDRFFLEVFEDVGSVVDPDKPMNGTREDDANLQFGMPVVDGSFEINGVTIGVNAGDTLNEVLAKITGSAAGVTATFDAATERVILTQNTAGSGPTIALANDTSGFLTTTKLDSAVLEPGTSGDSFSLLSKYPAFDTVTSGGILVNGTAIAIDPAADSLRDVLLRINGSGAGALATLSNDNERVTIRPIGGAENLVLDGNGTGFFAAINIDNGTYERGEARLSSRAVSAIGSGIEQVAAAFDGVFGAAVDFRSESASAERLRSEVKTLIADVVDRIDGVERPALLTAFDPNTALLDFNEESLDDGSFGRELRADFDTFKRRLLGDKPDGRAGFLSDLVALLGRTETGTQFELGIVGALISVYA